MGSPNTSRVLLSSAVRAVSTSCPKQTAQHSTAIRLYLNVTMASGSGGLQAVVRGYDKETGQSIELTAGGAAVTTTGLVAYEMNSQGTPAAAAGSIREAICRSIPYEWDVLVKHLDGSEYAYSLSADVMND